MSSIKKVKGFKIRNKLSSSVVPVSGPNWWCLARALVFSCNNILEVDNILAIKANNN